MAYFLKNNSYTFKDHPMFHGVSIAKLAGKDQKSPAGVSMLQIEPETEIPVHVHEDSIDSIYVMAGSAEIFTSGRWVPASPGDYCLVPAGEEHGVRNNGNEILQLFIVHSPPLF